MALLAERPKTKEPSVTNVNMPTPTPDDSVGMFETVTTERQRDNATGDRTPPPETHSNDRTGSDHDPFKTSALMPDRFNPGSYLTPTEVRIALAAVTAETGLGEQDVAINAWGFPPIPRPPANDRRFPDRLTATHAGHPVFWLDDETRRQQPDEDAATWVIRIWVELVDRGWIRPEAGETVCVLSVAGLDTSDPDTVADIERHLTADRKDWLAHLVIEPRRDPGPLVLAASGIGDQHVRSPGWATRAAKAEATLHADQYATFTRQAARPAAEVLRSADTLITAANFERHEAAIRSGAATLASTGDKTAVLAAVDAAIEEAVAVDHSRIFVRAHIENLTRWGPSPTLAGDEDQASTITHNQWASDDVGPLLAGVLVSAAGGDSSDRLIDATRTVWSAAITEARTTLWAARQVLDNPPAPPGLIRFSDHLADGAPEPAWAHSLA